MFFLPAIVVAAWIAGVSAGILVTVLSAIAVWYWWLPELHTRATANVATVLHLFAFIIIGSGIAYFLGEGRRAIHALRAAQAREAALREDYEVTLRSIGDAVIATDADGHVTFMNAVAEKLTACSFATARGSDVESIFEIAEEDTRVRMPSPVRRVLAQKKVIGLQNHTVLLARDGHEIPIADSAAPIFGAEGELRGVVLVFHDVLEQANARRELRAANAALEQQISDLRQLQELSWKVCSATGLRQALDEVLRAALEVNRTDKGLLSLVANEGTGLTVAASHGFSEEFLQKVQFVPSANGACGSCYAKRQRVIVEDVTTDPLFESYRAAAADGGFRAVHSTPLITRAGKMIGVLSVQFVSPHRPTERETRLMDLYARNAADLLENAQLREQLQRELDVRQATAEELRIANERFKLASHGETLTLFEQDRDLRYRWLYPLREQYASAIGRADSDLVAPAEAAPVVALKRDVLTRGEVGRTEVKVSEPQGVRYFDVTVSPKRNVKGEIEGVAGVAFDITARKQTELELMHAKDELARINRELEERVRERTASLTDLLSQMETFSYTVSHDLRSPLRAMCGFAEVLLEDHSAGLNEQGREMVKRIIRGGERMHRLINDVLAYTRVNRDRLELVPISLEEVLRQVVQHAPELQPPRASIVVQAPLPHVLGNEAFLTQVLANLLGNAVKFVPHDRQPRVEITAERHGSFVRLSLADNGIGIKPEHQARLFGLFERLNVDKHYEGTGMGLAIVRRAVERMGGSVGLESDGRTGSRFWLDLPAVPKLAEPENVALESANID
jgi:PAS domain S-box-containing protein